MTSDRDLHTLESAGTDMIRSAVRLLSAHKEELPVRDFILSFRLVRGKGGTSLKQEHGQRISWRDALSIFGDDVRSLPEFDALVRLIQATSSEFGEDDARLESDSLIFLYLDGLDAPVYNPARAQLVVGRFAKFIREALFHVTFLAPLAFYKCKARPFSLPDSSIVRPIRPAEYSLLGCASITSTNDHFLLLEATHLLEYAAVMPLRRHLMASHIDQLLHYDCSLLRVFGPSRPALAFVVPVPEWNSPLWHLGRSSSIRRKAGKEEAYLSGRDVPHLRRFAKQASRLQWREKVCNELRTAWLHFTESIDCRYHEDALLRLVTALEALYLENDAELALKLALRTAHHIGRTATDRHRVFAAIREAYRLRSSLTHGSKAYGQWYYWPGDDIREAFIPGTPPAVASPFIDDLTEIVSRCIRAYVAEIDDGQSKKRILRRLDSGLP